MDKAVEDFLVAAVNAGFINQSQRDELRAIIESAPGEDTDHLFTTCGLFSTEQVAFLKKKISSSTRSFELPKEVKEAVKNPKNTVGQFVIVSQIGMGGMGAVMKAWDKNLRQYVAIKFIRRTSETLIERFRREAKVLANISHPCIVRMFGLFEAGDVYFLSMQYVDGTTIEKAELESRELLETFRKICQAVHYAHSRGVIHRDIKPANIMVDSEGNSFIMDFGIAKTNDSADETGGLTATNEIIGTPVYMSPEQAKQSRNVDERSDVYSLGATLYRLITGKEPFQSDTILGLLEEVARREPVRPRMIKQDIPKPLEQIILKAMSKDPFRRYKTASDLASDIDNYLSGRAVTADAIKTTKKMFAIQKKKNPAMVFGAIAAAIVIIVAAAFLLKPPNQKQLQQQPTQEKSTTTNANAEPDTGALQKKADALFEAGKFKDALDCYEEIARIKGSESAVKRASQISTFIEERQLASKAGSLDGEMSHLKLALKQITDSDLEKELYWLQEFKKHFEQARSLESAGSVADAYEEYFEAEKILPGKMQVAEHAQKCKPEWERLAAEIEKAKVPVTALQFKGGLDAFSAVREQFKTGKVNGEIALLKAKCERGCDDSQIALAIKLESERKIYDALEAYRKLAKTYTVSRIISFIEGNIAKFESALNSAEALLKGESFPEAIQECEKAAQICESSRTAELRKRILWEWAKKSYESGKTFDRCVQCIMELMTLGERAPQLFDLRGRSHYQMARRSSGEAKTKLLGSAIADFNEWLADDSNSALAFCRRGLCYYEGGDYKAAISDFEAAKKLDEPGYSGLCASEHKDALEKLNQGPKDPPVSAKVAFAQPKIGDPASKSGGKLAYTASLIPNFEFKTITRWAWSLDGSVMAAASESEKDQQGRFVVRMFHVSNDELVEEERIAPFQEPVRNLSVAGEGGAVFALTPDRKQIKIFKRDKKANTTKELRTLDTKFQNVFSIFSDVKGNLYYVGGTPIEILVALAPTYSSFRVVAATKAKESEMKDLYIPVAFNSSCGAFLLSMHYRNGKNTEELYRPGKPPTIFSEDYMADTYGSVLSDTGDATFLRMKKFESGDWQILYTRNLAEPGDRWANLRTVKWRVDKWEFGLLDSRTAVVYYKELCLIDVLELDSGKILQTIEYGGQGKAYSLMNVDLSKRFVVAVKGVSDKNELTEKFRLDVFQWK